MTAGLSYPNPHAASHAPGGDDPVSISGGGSTLAIGPSQSSSFTATPGFLYPCTAGLTCTLPNDTNVGDQVGLYRTSGATQVKAVPSGGGTVNGLVLGITANNSLLSADSLVIVELVATNTWIVVATVGDDWGLGLHLSGFLTTASACIAQTFQPVGLTGATAATRYAGGTTSGFPASGTFALGDMIPTQDGNIVRCITAGTVGSGAAFAYVGAALKASPIYKKTVTVTPSATLGVQGATQTLSPDTGFNAINIPAPENLQCTASGLSAETLTVDFTMNYSDGTSSATTAPPGITTNGAVDVFTNLFWPSLFKDGVTVTSITVSVASSKASSTASVVVTALGTNGL